MTNPANGVPALKTRNDKLGFDRWEWPNGFGVTLYDDGRIKIGSWDQQVVQIAFDSRRPGKSRGGWRANFAPKREQA